MKAKELREQSLEELREKSKSMDQELFSLRLQKATRQLGNTAMISRVRKDRARVKTVVRELELAEAKQS
jgi:large subunit ribosomal protein L29